MLLATYPERGPAYRIGALVLFLLNIVLWATCYTLLKRGWKIKQ